MHFAAYIGGTYGLRFLEEASTKPQDKEYKPLSTPTPYLF
jgi:hypothetical protein